MFFNETDFDSSFFSTKDYPQKKGSILAQINRREHNYVVLIILESPKNMYPAVLPKSLGKIFVDTQPIKIEVMRNI